MSQFRLEKARSAAWHPANGGSGLRARWPIGPINQQLQLAAGSLGFVQHFSSEPRIFAGNG